VFLKFRQNEKDGKMGKFSTNTYAIFSVNTRGTEKIVLLFA